MALVARPESLAPSLGGVPDDEVHKVTHENAMRLCSFDAYAHVAREQGTVAALGARATDVDLTLRSSARLKKDGHDIVSVMDLAGPR